MSNILSSTSGAPLLALRTAILTLAHSGAAPGALVSLVVARILALWREEEQRKEQRKVEEEAIYRTTVHREEEAEEEQERQEYAKLFPTFAELFSDLTGEESLEGREVEGRKGEEAEGLTAGESEELLELVGLVQRLLLHEEPSKNR